MPRCCGGGGGGQSPSLVEGGGGGGFSSSCPIVGVLCVVRRRRVGLSSSVMSVHGISVLYLHRRCLARSSLFVVDPSSCFPPSC